MPDQRQLIVNALATLAGAAEREGFADDAALIYMVAAVVRQNLAGGAMDTLRALLAERRPDA